MKTLWEATFLTKRIHCRQVDGRCRNFVHDNILIVIAMSLFVTTTRQQCLFLGRACLSTPQLSLDFFTASACASALPRAEACVLPCCCAFRVLGGSLLVSLSCSLSPDLSFSPLSHTTTTVTITTTSSPHCKTHENSRRTTAQNTRTTPQTITTKLRQITTQPHDSSNMCFVLLSLSSGIQMFCCLFLQFCIPANLLLQFLCCSITCCCFCLSFRAEASCACYRYLEVMLAVVVPWHGAACAEIA